MNNAAAVQLHRASKSFSEAGDIIFVHGLNGSAADTWSWSADPDAFWPNWLSTHANIWVLDYPAALFWWASSGASMAIPERARSIIDLLLSHKLGDRPLIFVAHSLGGLL